MKRAKAGDDAREGVEQENGPAKKTPIPNSASASPVESKVSPRIKKRCATLESHDESSKSRRTEAELDHTYSNDKNCSPPEAGNPSAEYVLHNGGGKSVKAGEPSGEKLKRKVSGQMAEPSMADNKILKCASKCTRGGVDQHKGVSAGSANTDSHCNN